MSERSKDGIAEFCSILQEILEWDPELRLGQQICFAYGITTLNRRLYNGDLWGAEGDEFLERLLNKMLPPSNECTQEKKEELARLQERLRGRIMDLKIFNGEDWRLDPEMYDE